MLKDTYIWRDPLGTADMDNPNQLLKDLVEALESAFISSWQSTAAWQKQLQTAREYLDRLKEHSR